MALAVIRVTLERGYRYSLREQVSGALALLEPKLAVIKRKAGEPAVLDQVLDFFRGRLKALWSEAHRADVVEAVLTAGFDPLRDEGEAYGERLREAGVPVTVKRYPSLSHGYLNVVGTVTAAAEPWDDLVAALQHHLA